MLLNLNCLSTLYTSLQYPTILNEVILNPFDLFLRRIDCLQLIPSESNDKDMAAMLDELTIESNEESSIVFL